MYKLESKWPDAYKLLFDDNIDLNALDVALVNGVLGVYNNEDNRREIYGSWLSGSMMPGVIDRLKTVLSEEIGSIEKEIKEIETNAINIFNKWEEKEKSDPSYFNSREFKKEHKDVFKSLKRRKKLITEKKELETIYNEIETFENSKRDLSK